MEDRPGVTFMPGVDVDRAARLLADVIARNKAAIEKRWLEVVKRNVVDTPGIELTQLRDGLPDYLDALVALLRRGEVRNLEPGGEAAWSKVAREHGVTRVQLGFDITQLLHEFTILRQVIREVAGADELAIEAVLSDVLDAAVTAAVKAYVDARDFEGRRRQAQHIGFLTHELRNPLSTAMLTTAELRKRGSADAQPLLDILDRNHRRLSDLIDGVLASERLAFGKVESHSEAVKLGPLMDAALEGARAAAAEKGLHFHAELDPGADVMLDPALTRTAIQNLADNAVKYTDAGKVEVTVESKGEALVIHVRDSCRGISPEEMRTLFAPFERGERDQPGSGLGLALAKRAIEGQGGTINAESPGTSGCHFWITLPVAAR